MLISVRVVKHPRKNHKCDFCGRPIAGSLVRLFGAAEYGDRPYLSYIHPHQTEDCGWQSKDVLKALSKLETHNG